MLYEQRDILEEESRKIELIASSFTHGGSAMYRITNWTNVYTALSVLREFSYLEADYNKIISHGDQFNSSVNNPSIGGPQFQNFKNDVNCFRGKCESIVAFIDSVYGTFNYDGAYVHIKLPDELGVNDLEYISTKLNFFINNCTIVDGIKEPKIVGVEKGSNFLTLLLSNTREIEEVIMLLSKFGAFLLICAQIYKTTGKGFLLWQKGKREKFDREELEKKAKEKNKEYSNDTIDLIEEHEKELAKAELRGHVLTLLKESNELKDIKLDGQEENRIVKCVEHALLLYDKGVDFIPNKRINDEMLKKFPDAQDTPELESQEPKLLNENTENEDK